MAEKSMQDMKVADLASSPYNPRKITDKKLAMLGKAMKEYGDLSGIVFNRGTGRVVGGHQRIKHLDPSWPIMKQVVKDDLGTVAIGFIDTPFGRWTYREVNWPEKKEIAANIAANQHSGEFDIPALQGLFIQIDDGETDMELTGFTADELAEILGGSDTVKDGLTDPDDVPEPPDEATTQPGDLWILGDHRLLCGDSGSTEDVDRLLAGASIHLVNTDPPYNVKVEPRSNNAIAAGNSSFGPSGTKAHHQGFDLARDKTKAKRTTQKLRPKDRQLMNDFVSDEEFDRLLRAWFGNIARVLEPGRGFYIWGGYANCANYPPVLKENKLYFSQSIIWVKEHPVLTRKDFMGNHEWCFYGWKEGAAHHWLGPTNATDVWSIKKVNPQNMIHLTEKPVELAVRAMQYSSRPGENVLDLFGGSGSTLIAAEQTGRKSHLMELDPLYCDVIVQRYENFTGKKAERFSNGERLAV